MEGIASLVHVFNLLFQSLELRLIDARNPFDRRPNPALSQETLDHFTPDSLCLARLS